MKLSNFISRFSQKPNITHLTAEYYFGSSLKIKGIIRTKSDIYLDAKFKGELYSDGAIEIDANAIVDVANAEARALILHGKLKGNIKIKQTATISGAAALEGNLTAKEVEIMPGATVSAIINTGNLS